MKMAGFIHTSQCSFLTRRSLCDPSKQPTPFRATERCDSRPAQDFTSSLMAHNSADGGNHLKDGLPGAGPSTPQWRTVNHGYRNPSIYKWLPSSSKSTTRRFLATSAVKPRRLVICGCSIKRRNLDVRIAMAQSKLEELYEDPNIPPEFGTLILMINTELEKILTEVL